MRQARKSRHHLFTIVALATMVACAAIAPAIAGAEPGADEYTLNVPGEGNNPVDESSGGGDGSDTSSSVSPPTTDETTDTTTTDSTESDDSASGGGAAAGGGGGGGDKADGGGASGGGSGSGDKARDDLVASNASAPTSSASGSDDGGVPVFLIVIAVLAAVCVGFAVWRMRRSEDGDEADAATREVDPRTQST